MKPEQHHGPLEPQDVEELLPWYVTGRVSREEVSFPSLRARESRA